MEDDPLWVDYEDIPLAVRNILDEIYQPEGCEIWWNTPNVLMAHYVRSTTQRTFRPREMPAAAYDLANALADGVFF